MTQEEAIKILKDFHDESALFSVRTALETLYPELKESEDERIIKILQEGVNDVLQDQFCTNRGVSKEKVLSWLEKQGKETSEKEFTFKALPRLLEMIEVSDRAKAYTEKLAVALDNEGYHTDAKIVRESIKIMNGEEVPMATMDEQKHVDKVEPKFKVGDWVIRKDGKNFSNGCKFAQITAIDKEQYWFDSGTWLEKEEIRLWTIQDAKEGDVLAAYECYVIFKEIDGLNIKCYCTYHYMNNPSFHVDTLQNKDAFHPATKEQRDQIEKAMADAGYEFDFKEKVLKKIEPKSAWSEEDEEVMRGLLSFLLINTSDQWAKYGKWLKSLKNRIKGE